MQSRQFDINAKMRAILIDWLVEVHHKFKLRPETMYLTVHLIDRYLEKEAVQRNKLQLVGITAMFVASKYEEIYAPECRDFVYISDKAYTREQILSTEGNMLAKLNFQLTAPNAYVFLKRFCKVAGVLSAQRTHADLLASYLVELTLQEYDMLKYLPSTIAASAVFLALKTLGKEPWTSDLAQHAGYSEAALMPCVREINRLHKAAGGAKLQAVRKKSRRRSTAPFRRTRRSSCWRGPPPRRARAPRRAAAAPRPPSPLLWTPPPPPTPCPPERTPQPPGPPVGLPPSAGPALLAACVPLSANEIDGLK